MRARLGDHQADKTVTVKPYVLPKFKVEVKADKTFYLPKETIQAALQSDYFFGKPVADQGRDHGQHVRRGVQRLPEVDTITDEKGHAKFEIELPDYFVGQPLAKGNALVKLEVKVPDTADHTETITSDLSGQRSVRSRSA